MPKEKTFIKITNHQIYNKICEIKEANENAHNEIIARQLETNGKVKLNKWIATTALSLVMLIICVAVGVKFV